MSGLYAFLHKWYVRSLVYEAQSKTSATQNPLTIDLSSTDLDRLPEELYALGSNFATTLRKLMLDYNRIERLPAACSSFAALVYLNLSHNPKLGEEGLFAGLSKLESLEALWCNSVGLSELPEELCELPNLRTLGARGNGIKRLPKAFAKLTKLSWLTLQNNLLEELPEGLGVMDLVHVNVSCNCLHELPSDITTYRSLQYFMANNNQINCLPLMESTKWDLSGMASLVYIDLRNNPVEEDSNFKQYFQEYPQLKSTMNDFHIERDNNVENQQVNRAPGDSPNENPENNNNNDIPDNLDDDSDSSSYEDWEHSITSTQLNFEEQSEDELDENEIKGIDIPLVSRFAGTGC